MSLIRVVSIGYCCLFGLTLAHAADEFSVDTAFIRKAEQTTEQAMVDTRFALKMSLNGAIKQAARMLQSDGIAANRKLLALAVEKGWAAPVLDTADTTRDYSDYHFVSWQIRLQQRAIALYKQEAEKGADTDLQAFARDALPALKRGLNSLRSLRSS